MRVAGIAWAGCEMPTKPFLQSPFQTGWRENKMKKVMVEIRRDRVYFCPVICPVGNLKINAN